MTRLGIIGLGGRVAGLVKNWFRAYDPDVRVAGFVDPDEEGARARLDECDRADAVRYPDVAALVRGARPDGLVIGTRCNLHTPYAIEAAAYGLPLFLEKPVAVSMEQALALEEAFERSPCPVVVSFPLRVSGLCIQAREMIRSGALGAPEHILAANYVPYGTVYWEDGYRDYAVTQGLFLQKATHDFDYIADLMGSPIVSVSAMASLGRVFGGQRPSGLRCSACGETDTCLESPASRARNGSGGCGGDHACLYSVDCGNPEDGMNEDASSALLAFASGAHGVYTQVFYTRRRPASRRGAVVSGYSGTLDFDWYRGDIKMVPHHAPFLTTVGGQDGHSHFGGDSQLAGDFIAVIKGKGQPRTTIWDGIQSCYACLAAKASVKSGRIEEVRQVGGMAPKRQAACA